jgi:hypothetical protein
MSEHISQTSEKAAKRRKKTADTPMVEQVETAQAISKVDRSPEYLAAALMLKKLKELTEEQHLMKEVPETKEEADAMSNPIRILAVQIIDAATHLPQHEQADFLELADAQRQLSPDPEIERLLKPMLDSGRKNNVEAARLEKEAFAEQKLMEIVGQIAGLQSDISELKSSREGLIASQPPETKLKSFFKVMYTVFSNLEWRNKSEVTIADAQEKLFWMHREILKFEEEARGVMRHFSDEKIHELDEACHDNPVLKEILKDERLRRFERARYGVPE